MEEFIHLGWRFLRTAVEPPSQQRQQAPGQSRGARSQFALRNLRKAFGLSEAMLDATRKVGLRQIKEIVEAPRAGKDAIELSLIFDVSELFRHGNNAIRRLFANAEFRAHHFQEYFQLAEE